jgi:hypothetical protein
MALTMETGPIISTGNLNPAQNSDWESGPNLANMGGGILDPRYVASIGEAPDVGGVFGMYENPQITLVDGFPQAPVAAAIFSFAPGAVATAAAGGTAMTLVASNSLAAAVNVPMIPWVTTRTANPTTDGKVAGYGLSSVAQGWTPGNVVTAGLALDYGSVFFTLPATGTVTPTTLTSNATTSNAVVPSNQGAVVYPANQILTILTQSTTNWKNPLKFYVPGQYVVVPGAGNAAGTSCLLAQVIAIDYVQGFLVLNTQVLNTSSNATGVGVGSADPLGIAAWPYFRAGAIGVVDPSQMISRTLALVSSSVSDTSYLTTIQGYDVWGQPMTEQLTTNGTTIVLGKKAWKYITAVTISSATTPSVGTITLGTAATTTGAFGFSMKIDQFEYLSIFANGAYVTANTGFTAGLAPTTNPATYTTADNRGTYAMQTAPSGAVHLALYGNFPQQQVANANNINYNQLFGLPQT